VSLFPKAFCALLLVFSFTSLTAGATPASKTTSAKTSVSRTGKRQSHRAIAPVRKESFAQLKELLVGQGYRNILDDDGHQTFQPGEADNLEELSRHEIKIAGKPMLAVYFEVSSESTCWGELTILALYSRTPKLHIIDAVNVQGDRECYPEPNLNVSPQDDVLFVNCTHLSAGEECCLLALYGLIDGKITRLDKTIPFVFSVRTKSLSLASDYKISVLKGASGKRGKILFRIREVETHFKQDDQVISRRINIYTVLLLPQGNYYIVSPHDKGIALMKLRQKSQDVDRP
jgi:hypothetical protein